jgi:hypothetical protein
MDADIDRYPNLARVHDLARDRALELRREAVARFWSQFDTVLALAAARAWRGGRRLWARLRRRAARRILVP